VKRALLGTLVAATSLAIPSAFGGHTADPASVTIAGSLQSELGCSGDWQPDCAATHLAYDANDDVWQATFTVPAGSWEYKAPLNDAWDENYGAGAAPNGANIGLSLGAGTSVKFFYDHDTHWVTDDVNSVIATVPGSFQSALGCSGDWDPSCLRSWLQDADGDGIYAFETTALAAGSYEAKVTIDESWAENYGAGGVPNGPNISFTVPVDNAKVTFSYDAASHVLTIRAGHAPDDNVEWDGLRHDSRDTLYRTPGGAVPAGASVLLRFRTFHDDVTAVRARIFDVDANAQTILAMERVASGVSCYQASLGDETCDFWQVELENADPNNLWYRFVVTDGSDVDYYADNTPALDGGLGQTTEDPVDHSYALTVYEPGFTTPAWSHTGLLYQIFPDRFRNGKPQNDPQTGDVRYDDPVLALPWGEKPEGYCRNYAVPDEECQWRYDDTPPSWSPEREGPRGRDYFGGDLRGVIEKLDYLEQLGVTAIYFNPIFAAKSNHRYDTANYRQIDPGLGTLKDFKDLVAGAEARGIRVILDGVFNHMSSDSPFFDRYGHYDATGACESLSSQWRSWFEFTTENVPCGTGDYVGWFGFDSIPVLTKTNPDVRAYFVDDANSVSRLWLHRGAAGWRLDVSGDPSFPSGYWEAFRNAVKSADPDSLHISETWGKDTTLLRILRGDRLDTTMNYRLRDAILGLLAPAAFDAKGFPDSGGPIAPSQFAARLAAIYEDYAPAARASLMNLLDSHDTERILWTLTPGAETPAAKEDADNLAVGKQRLRQATLVQFTVPGMPTVYYGDEVGMTGDDDPDDRRTYPWDGPRDLGLLAHYQALADLRADHPALTGGDLKILLADDEAGTVAYGRKTGTEAVVVAVNRTGESRTVTIPLDGFVPEGTDFEVLYAVGGDVTVSSGSLVVTLPALGGALLGTGTIDLAGPAAPAALAATEGSGQVSLAWNAVDGAAGYNVYRSPVTGGGYVEAGSTSGTSFTDTGVANGRTYYYVVRAVDEAGNESGDSNEVSALPHYTIGWANLQWPPSMTHTISTDDRTDNVYGQVWIDGVTNQPGPTDTLVAQLGFGPDGSDPAGNEDWVWVDAAFNVDAGNNDEFVASLLPDGVGTYDYAYRYSTTDGRDWVYADLDGIGNGYSTAQAGSLTVFASGDTTAPAAPTGLAVVGASPAGIDLAWNAVTGDATLHGYEVRRSETAGGPYATLDLVTGTTYADTDVTEGRTYYYVVRAVDTSFNRSAPSNEVSAVPELRTVSVTFDVTVPASTDGTGRSVYVAGTLNRLDGGLPEWNPGGVVLTRVDATHWTVTLTGKESTQLEYKYTLGDWEHVEKDAGCGEIANRQLTLAYGSSGTQTVSDTVLNWRNVSPCGN